VVYHTSPYLKSRVQCRCLFGALLCSVMQGIEFPLKANGYSFASACRHWELVDSSSKPDGFWKPGF